MPVNTLAGRARRLRMTRFLRQLVPLIPGEGRKIAQFSAVAFLLQAGMAVGTSAADSAFLAHVGAAMLPRIYVAVPLLALAYIPLTTWALARWGMDRVFDVTLGAIVAGGGALWFALGHAAPGALWAFYAAKLYTALWYIGLYTLFWNFADEYFDLFDAKRVFSLFAAGSAAGAILGGSLVGPISRRFGVDALFLVWAAGAALTWPVARWTRRRWPRLATADGPSADRPASPAETGWVWLTLLRNRYALVLTLALGVTLIAATTCEFQYLGIFATGRTEAQIAALLGRLTAMVNVFNLAVTLFLFNRLVKRIGVRNVALIQTFAYAAVFCWLLLDGRLPAAIAGFFAYQGLMTAIDFNNANLLFAGLPAEHGKALRTTIEGLCEPLAAAAAGLFLLLTAARFSPEGVSLAGAGIALGGLALAFVLRSDYAAAIGANLRRDWLDFSLSAEPLWRRTADGDLDLAEARTHTAQPRDAVLALRLLWIHDPPRGVRALLAYLRERPTAALAAGQGLLDEVLADPAHPAAPEIQRWIEEGAAGTDPVLAGALGRHALLPEPAAEALLRSAGPEARAAGAAALWQSWRVTDGRRALREIEALLAAGDERARRAGLRGLGQLGEPRYAYLLREYLRAPAGPVRGAALAALRTLAAPSAHALVPDLVARLREDAGADRLLALEAFERIGDAGELGALLAAAESFTPSQRRRLETLIQRLGPRCVPVLVESVQDLRLSNASRSVALRALGKLALPQVHLLARPLVDAIAHRAYLFLAAHETLAAEEADEPGRIVLARFFADYPNSALEFALEILAVSGRLANFDAMVAALRAGSSKERGYAIEAIEQACDHATFTLLLPLLDGRPIAAQVQSARHHGIVPDFTVDQVLDWTLETGLPLAAAAAAQALLAGPSGDAIDRVIERTTRSPHPLLVDTVILWLARRGRTPGGADEPTPVEAVRRFMAAPEFASFRSSHFEFLAPLTRRAAFPPGAVLCRRGEPLPGSWLVLSGRVRVGAGGPDLVAGSVAAGEALVGARTAETTLEAAGALQALFLPGDALRHCAETFPELGLALLAQKLAA